MYSNSSGHTTETQRQRLTISSVAELITVLSVYLHMVSISYQLCDLQFIILNNDIWLIYTLISLSKCTYIFYHYF